MSESTPTETKVWVPKEELDNLFEACDKKSYFANLLIGDFYEASYTITERAKLLLKEVFCLIETNMPYYKELVEKQTMEKDGRPGYFLGQGDLLSLTTVAVSLKKISFELEEQNLSLEVQ